MFVRKETKLYVAKSVGYIANAEMVFLNEVLQVVAPRWAVLSKIYHWSSQLVTRSALEYTVLYPENGKLLQRIIIDYYTALYAFYLKAHSRYRGI